MKLGIGLGSPKWEIPDQSVIKPSETFRTWKSSNGNFSLNAKVVGLTSEGVRLENREGKIVTVPLEKLCEEDAAYIKARK